MMEINRLEQSVEKLVEKKNAEQERPIVQEREKTNRVEAGKRGLQQVKLSVNCLSKNCKTKNYRPRKWVIFLKQQRTTILRFHM